MTTNGGPGKSKKGYDKRELILCVVRDKAGNVGRGDGEHHIGRRIFDGSPEIRLASTFACGERPDANVEYYFFVPHAFLIQNNSVCDKCAVVAMRAIDAAKRGLSNGP